MLTRSLGARWGTLGWGLLCSGLVAGACSKNGDIIPQGKPGLEGSGGGGFTRGGGAGRGGSAGKGASGEGGNNEGGAAGVGAGDTGATGGTAGTSMNVPGAPVVEITSPKAVSKPSDVNVIVADEIDLLCTVTKSTDKGASVIDATTVSADMLDADGKVVDTQAGVPTGNANEFTAHFITRKVPDNGRISFGCRGSDSSTPPLTGGDQVTSYIDHGPTIEPIEPHPADVNTAKFATSVGAPLKVRFKVSEAPVAKGDTGARIGDVSLTVGGKPFTLDESDGEYTATVHLNDKTIFSPTPDGDEKIVITAANSRKPKAAANESAYDFTVDGTGPDIAIVTPGAGDVGSGSVNLVFKITDTQSGVDPSSVAAIINQHPYYYSDTDLSWSFDPVSSTYTFNFDTTQIEKSTAQATLTASALDNVGNESHTAAITFFLDNVPPFVELDPLPVREKNVDTAHCSTAFDPVGSAAANDLQVVLDYQTFRALVWDDSNHAAGQDVLRASRTDANSVVLFLQPHPEQGLLKDTTGDGTCDEIETKDLVSGNALPALPLFPIPSQGGSFFGSATNEDETFDAEFPMPSDCGYEGATTAPPTLCEAKASDMFRVVHWELEPASPAIFGIAPLEGLTCTGDGWEIQPFVTEGWICAAARATDQAGNIGISQPIRLCYDDGVKPDPDCAGPNPVVPPPSCVVNDCVLPPRFIHKPLPL